MLIERVSYDIDWKKFKAGTSFFIPCLDCTIAEETILKVTKRLKIDVIMKISIENNIKGLRVWRI
jgi:hypothetical protein